MLDEASQKIKQAVEAVSDLDPGETVPGFFRAQSNVLRLATTAFTADVPEKPPAVPSTPVHFPSTTSSKRRGMWPTIAEDARRYGIVVRATSSKDLLVAELSKLIQKIGLEPGSKRKLSYQMR